MSRTDVGAARILALLFIQCFVLVGSYSTPGGNQRASGSAAKQQLLAQYVDSSLSAKIAKWFEPWYSNEFVDGLDTLYLRLKYGPDSRKLQESPASVVQSERIQKPSRIIASSLSSKSSSNSIDKRVGINIGNDSGTSESSNKRRTDGGYGFRNSVQRTQQRVQELQGVAPGIQATPATIRNGAKSRNVSPTSASTTGAVRPAFDGVAPAGAGYGIGAAGAKGVLSMQPSTISSPPIPSAYATTATTAASPSHTMGEARRAVIDGVTPASTGRRNYGIGSKPAKAAESSVSPPSAPYSTSAATAATPATQQAVSGSSRPRYEGVAPAGSLSSSAAAAGRRNYGIGSKPAKPAESSVSPPSAPYSTPAAKAATPATQQAVSGSSRPRYEGVAPAGSSSSTSAAAVAAGRRNYGIGSKPAKAAESSVSPPSAPYSTSPASQATAATPATQQAVSGSSRPRYEGVAPAGSSSSTSAAAAGRRNYGIGSKPAKPAESSVSPPSAPYSTSAAKAATPATQHAVSGSSRPRYEGVAPAGSSSSSSASSAAAGVAGGASAASRRYYGIGSKPAKPAYHSGPSNFSPPSAPYSTPAAKAATPATQHAVSGSSRPRYEGVAPAGSLSSSSAAAAGRRNYGIGSKPAKPAESSVSPPSAPYSTPAATAATPATQHAVSGSSRPRYEGVAPAGSSTSAAAAAGRRNYGIGSKPAKPAESSVSGVVRKFDGVAPARGVISSVPISSAASAPAASHAVSSSDFGVGVVDVGVVQQQDRKGAYGFGKRLSDRQKRAAPEMQAGFVPVSPAGWRGNCGGSRGVPDPVVPSSALFSTPNDNSTVKDTFA